jgi:hypothetical protein
MRYPQGVASSSNLLSTSHLIYTDIQPIVEESVRICITLKKYKLDVLLDVLKREYPLLYYCLSTGVTVKVNHNFHNLKF